jgi:Arc/MetJ-type ribon-helix-helix transcriptional regulator
MVTPPPTRGSKKVYVTLPEGARALLDQLVEKRTFGDSHSEVARHFIVVGLNDLVDKGRLKEPERSPMPKDEEPTP